MFDIKDMLLTNHNRPKKKIIKLKGIVIHYTGNYKKGADAKANRNYFNGTNDAVSAHYIVDDKSIIRCVPDNEIAYHVGAKKYTSIGEKIQEVINGVRYSPNYFLIGIEMCVNNDGDWKKTYQNTVELAAYLLQKYKLTVLDLYRHYDITGKICPAMMINEADWNVFREAVKKKMDRPVLRIGSKGEEVRELQENLIKLGYDLGKWGADGDFGNATYEAVKKLQKDHGLEDDGVVGKNTYALLDRLLNQSQTSQPQDNPYPTIRLGDKGELVRLLQEKLNRKGYNLKVDGDFGGKTETAVKDYQKKNGLTSDGVVGPKTWSKLLSSIEVVEVGSNYKAFKRDSYINVIEVRKDKIKKVDLIVANTKNKLETLDSMYRRLPEKPLAMINGGLYFIDDKTGIAKSLNLLFTDDITYAIGSYSQKGFLFYPDGSIAFGEFKYTKGVQMIGGSPTIIEDGKIVLDKGNMENSLITTDQPRTAVGMNDEYFFLIAIDGRQKNMPGMTIDELSKFMLNSLSCKYGISLDGGGSTKMILNEKVYNSPTENRLLHNSLALYMR